MYSTENVLTPGSLAIRTCIPMFVLAFLRRQLNSAVALPAWADAIAACAGRLGRASGVVRGLSCFSC
eukprot:11052147-Heterocapsa_arctica.AAC.1